jgi:hypothetical protein
MNLKKYTALAGLSLLAMAPSALAVAHTVTGGLSATDLVNLLVPVDSGITIIGTPTFYAPSNPAQYGAFNNTTPADTGIPFNSGIILASGDIANSVGPNTTSSRTTQYGGPGSALLESATGIGSTRDAAILEFQFTSTANVFSFAYMFASEEYNEYVGSNFNDVFAFILNGPGYADQNLAVLPGNIPVTINNVNNGLNSAYYANNSPGPYNIEYDGLAGGGNALPLYVSATIQANQIYTISIAIADVGDNSYDSGVFLQGGSFTANEIPPDAVPEPATYIGALALVGLAARRFRKRA